MKKSKAVTINGYLVKIDSDGLIFRLNGIGVWNQISNVELFNLINEKEDEYWVEIDFNKKNLKK